MVAFRDRKLKSFQRGSSRRPENPAWAGVPAAADLRQLPPTAHQISPAQRATMTTMVTERYLASALGSASALPRPGKIVIVCCLR